jgi:hypothetical protein
MSGRSVSARGRVSPPTHARPASRYGRRDVNVRPIMAAKARAASGTISLGGPAGGPHRSPLSLIDADTQRGPWDRTGRCGVGAAGRPLLEHRHLAWLRLVVLFTPALAPRPAYVEADLEQVF